MIIFRMVGTFFWAFVLLSTFITLLFVVPQAYKSDTVTVPYLDGKRVCQGGYDFRRPQCVYVLSHEWDSKKRQMKWGVLDAETNEFLHYDGWYIERGEIEQELSEFWLAVSNQVSASEIDIHPMLYNWIARISEYNNWDDVNWEKVNIEFQEGYQLYAARQKR